MNNIAIKVSHLTKVYKLYDKPIDRLKESLHPLKKQYHKDFHALNDINFEIKKGETVGIIGKNGAGKSTLLKIITGILTPSSGHVHVNGRVASLLELGAGFNPEYTGLENIYLQGILMGYSHNEIEVKLGEIVDFADIGDFIHQPVKTYSSGMYARLAFAVAINVDPEILIVDEALSVGDMLFQSKCMARMKEMIEKKITILFVSHDIYAVQSLCNEAIFIDKGSLVKIGNVEEVTTCYVEIQREKNNQLLGEVNLKNKKVKELEYLSFSEDKIAIDIINKLDLSGTKLLEGKQSGNGKATILDFLFCDEEDNITTEIISNKEYNIYIAVKFNEDLESFAIICPIRSLNGIQEIGVSSTSQNFHFPQVKKNDIYILKISSVMNIKSGIYNLVLSVEIPMEYNRIHEFACVIENCLTFNVSWGNLLFPMQFFTEGKISYSKKNRRIE